MINAELLTPNAQHQQQLKLNFGTHLLSLKTLSAFKIGSAQRQSSKSRWNSHGSYLFRCFRLRKGEIVCRVRHS